MVAGVSPLNLGGYGRPAPLYRAAFLEQQLRSALCDKTEGPIDVWLWLAVRHPGTQTQDATLGGLHGLVC